MRRLLPVLVTVFAVLLAISAVPAAAGSGHHPRPGAPGIGDSYFPTDGNGGYDVAHYDLDLRYRPDSDRLSGRATIWATATQSLSQFNLDLNGLRVFSVRVNGHSAAWRHVDDELTIRPRHGLRKGSRFQVVVEYGGVPKVLDEPALGLSGAFPTDDGLLIVGQPHVADTWFPVNDHPLDKASYRFRVTVPRGLEVVANGRLAGVDRRGHASTWTWVAKDPMASYLATATIGQFRLDERTVAGVRWVDAIDPALYVQPEPRTGSRYLISGGDDNAYKRLIRTFTVPASGGRLAFQVARDTEPDWDFFFVEARVAGTNAWTTLPDANGHTDTSTGNSCPLWLELHPFLAHYQTAIDEQSCSPSGTTGSWHAASGKSDGYEQWSIDLSAYAGKTVQVALAAVNDDVAAYNGVYVDDVVGPGGQGSTSFEADGNPLDGWTVSGPPAGSPGNASDWRIATESAGTSIGQRAEEALDRGPEITAFLSGLFGPYPFRDAGGFVDDDPDVGFALENQTRPFYSKEFFVTPGDNTDVVAHELAHQWTGDYLALGRWRDIWLNEGFASYAQWLWSESQGRVTAQEYFDFYASIPADDEFWSVTVADPGADNIFAGAVYDRGAMTLHALRAKVGDAAFFRLLKIWVRSQAGGNVTSPEFERLAERASGQDLDAFFRTWLYTPTKPAGIEPAAARASRSKAAAMSVAAFARLRVAEKLRR